MRKRLILLALAGLLVPQAATAWHNEGHMAVARIAWEQLDDGQRKVAFQILQSHPHRDIFLAADRPAEVPEPMWFFVRAATWPDWVKDPHGPLNGPMIDPSEKAKIRHAYSKGNWHFVNLPFVHPDDTATFDAAALRKEALEPAFTSQGDPRHALAALPKVLQGLQDADTPAAIKATYLCWLLHLVGDLHQPLHASALISSKAKFEPPHGDKGGNRCAVKVDTKDQDALELHSYWDGLQFSGRPKFSEVEVKVLGWLKDATLQRDQFPELSKTELPSWAEESLELAKTVAYLDEGKFLNFIPLRSNFGPADLKNLDAPVLSSAYQQKAAAVAQKRLVLAGYRLGDKLKPVLKPAP